MSKRTVVAGMRATWKAARGDKEAFLRKIAAEFSRQIGWGRPRSMEVRQGEYGMPEGFIQLDASMGTDPSGVSGFKILWLPNGDFRAILEGNGFGGDFEEVKLKNPNSTSQVVALMVKAQKKLQGKPGVYPDSVWVD